MSRSVDEVYAEISALDPVDREEVLSRLLSDAFGPPDEGVTEAWREEAAQRVRDLRSGKESSRPWSEVKADFERRRPG